MEAAIPRARSTASAFVCGLSFQFPVMNAFLANNSVDEDDARTVLRLFVATKPLDDPSAERRRVQADTSFIVANLLLSIGI